MTKHELDHFVAGNTPKTVKTVTIIDGIKYTARKRLNKTATFKGNRLLDPSLYQVAIDSQPDAINTVTMLYRTSQETICLVYYNGTLERITRVHFNDDHVMVTERQSYFELIGA